MDKKSFEERVERIKEVDAIIKSLDPAIREASFKVLEPYITGKPPGPPITDTDSAVEHHAAKEEPVDSASFFLGFDHDKPADNVKLIVAYHYSQYGIAPISLGEVREMAKYIGLTIPAKSDMTLEKAQYKGKGLFTRCGRAQFKPTVHGEQYLKETYDVSKGRKKKPDSNQ